ncbi:MAG: RsmE family RNA methyltransferase [Cyclobacteriaceae bacterium]
MRSPLRLSMHLFYNPDLSKKTVELSNEEYRHCVKVLRHLEGDTIHITNGNGKIIEARIDKIDKGILSASKQSEKLISTPSYTTNLFIAPTKQMDRMEWMVEKCCEIGVTSITFIKTKNTERSHIKIDRLLKKSLSALKQSKNGWMTQIYEMVEMKAALSTSTSEIKLIAALKTGLNHIVASVRANRDVDIFIGPEGDFTDQEVAFAIKKGAKEVSLGKGVLRTETAGFFSCAAVNLINH